MFSTPPRSLCGAFADMNPKGKEKKKVILLTGRVVCGVGDSRKRIKNFPDVFRRATGENLFPGTLNVKVSKNVPIREDFRILGNEINEPEQDLLFEECRIDGIRAYRIRPYHLKTGGGGHGDDTLEIACSEEIPNHEYGSMVEITLFREDID